jgi:hypothetical protein
LALFAAAFLFATFAFAEADVLVFVAVFAA